MLCLQEVIYHIIDQPPPANDSTWYRVAAIVVTGAGWQFKDYPFEVCSLGLTDSP